MKIYDEFTKVFTNNGIGILKDIYNTECIESLNGEFTLSFEYPKNSKYSEYLKNRNILKEDIGYDEPQLFRIARVVPTLDSYKVYANHITYDLNDNLIEDAYPQEKGGQAFLDWIFERTQYEHGFSVFSDVSGIGTARYIRKKPIECLIGNIDNSFINIFGGELLRNNFKISMLKRRGSADTGYRIKYRKNLTGLEITEDDSSLATRLMPEGFDGMFLPEKYVDSPLIDKYSHPYIYVLDCSDIKLKEEGSDEGYDTLEECYSAMRERCNDAFEKQNVDKTKINIKIDFVDLKKTNLYKKYKHLQDLKLGDTVSVIVDKKVYVLRIIKTTYDFNLHRFTKLELGEFKNDFVTSTNSKINSILNDMIIQEDLILDKAKASATKQLTRALGGYIVKTRNEIFIMDTDDPATAKRVWRWNLNGLGYSSNGINGPYGLAMTQDGAFVADFITTGVLDANVIRTSWNGITNYIQLENGCLNIYDSNKKLVMQLNSSGNHFYRDGKYLGYIGTSQLVSDTSKKGFSFGMTQQAEYMEWGYDSNEDGEYTSVLRYKKSSNKLESYVTFSSSNIETYSIKSQSNLFIKASNYLYFGDDNYNYFVISANNGLEAYKDLNMNGYNIKNTNNVVSTNMSKPTVAELNIVDDSSAESGRYLQVISKGDYIGGVNMWTSDARLKENIEESGVNALEIINKINHRSFDWINNKKHIELGYIAQELEKINKSFVFKPGNEDDSIYQINETALIPYLTKSLQELYNMYLEQQKNISIILKTLELTPTKIKKTKGKNNFEDIYGQKIKNCTITKEKELEKINIKNLEREKYEKRTEISYRSKK